jgi:phage gp29-like protein
MERDSSLGEASARRYAAARKGRETPTWLTRLRRIKAALNAAERGDVRWCAVLKLDVEEA